MLVMAIVVDSMEEVTSVESTGAGEVDTETNSDANVASDEVANEATSEVGSENVVAASEVKASEVVRSDGVVSAD